MEIYTDSIKQWLRFLSNIPMEVLGEEYHSKVMFGVEFIEQHLEVKEQSLSLIMNELYKLREQVKEG